MPYLSYIIFPASYKCVFDLFSRLVITLFHATLSSYLLYFVFVLHAHFLKIIVLSPILNSVFVDIKYDQCARRSLLRHCTVLYWPLIGRCLPEKALEILGQRTVSPAVLQTVNADGMVEGARS